MVIPGVTVFLENDSSYEEVIVRRMFSNYWFERKIKVQNTGCADDVSIRVFVFLSFKITIKNQYGVKNVRNYLNLDNSIFH